MPARCCRNPSSRCGHLVQQEENSQGNQDGWSHETVGPATGTTTSGVIAVFHDALLTIPFRSAASVREYRRRSGPGARTATVNAKWNQPNSFSRKITPKPIKISAPTGTRGVAEFRLPGRLLPPERLELLQPAQLQKRPAGFSSNRVHVVEPERIRRLHSHHFGRGRLIRLDRHIEHERRDSQTKQTAYVVGHPDQADENQYMDKSLRIFAVVHGPNAWDEAQYRGQSRAAAAAGGGGTPGAGAPGPGGGGMVPLKCEARHSSQ